MKGGRDSTKLLPESFPFVLSWSSKESKCFSKRIEQANSLVWETVSLHNEEKIHNLMRKEFSLQWRIVLQKTVNIRGMRLSMHRKTQSPNINWLGVLGFWRSAGTKRSAEVTAPRLLGGVRTRKRTSGGRERAEEATSLFIPLRFSTWNCWGLSKVFPPPPRLLRRQTPPKGCLHSPMRSCVREYARGAVCYSSQLRIGAWNCGGLSSVTMKINLGFDVPHNESRQDSG